MAEQAVPVFFRYFPKTLDYAPRVYGIIHTEYVGEISLSLQSESGYHRPAIFNGLAVREDGSLVTMMEVFIDNDRRMGYICIYENRPDGTSVYDPERKMGSVLSFSVENREDAEAVYRFFRILKYRSW